MLHSIYAFVAVFTSVWQCGSLYLRIQSVLSLFDCSAENQLKYAEAQLDRLTKMNAFNCTFHIWHTDQFGTINGFRLGRLPNVPVNPMISVYALFCVLQMMQFYTC